MRGSGLSGQLTPCLCRAYTGWCSHISACAEASTGAWGEPHGQACAGSFPVVYGCSLL